MERREEGQRCKRPRVPEPCTQPSLTAGGDTLECPEACRGWRTDTAARLAAPRGVISV